MEIGAVVRGGTELKASAPRGGATAAAWWITVLLASCLAINFVDRLVLATVAPALLKQLHFTTEEYSYIVFAFMLGMTLGQIPAGSFIDRVGSRFGLSSILAGWSFSNMAQALAQGVASFSGLRFLMGLFECGNYSAGVKTIGEIFPAQQRALALGIFDSGSLIGSVIAPPLVVFTAARFGWRHAFFLPSVAGLVWLVPWLYSTRAERPAVMAEEVPNLPHKINMTMGQLLRLRQTWGVVAMRAFSGPLSQFYWYWLPLYFVRGRGLSMASMAGLASISYLVGGCGQMGAGYVSGLLIRAGWTVDRARKATFTVGAALAAICTFLAPLTRSSFDAALMVGMGIFGVNVMANHVIAIITDVFPEPTLARVTGTTGMGEGVINMAMTLFTGVVVDRFSWLPVFSAAAFMPFGALAGLFLLVRRSEPVR
jgi:MFS transporter, ACS family, aldohexuronate transporter